MITDFDGNAQQVIGSGDQGFSDGTYQTAAFCEPQGMALTSDKLYVADTKNHAIRRVDLTTQEVTTLAGVGEQSETFHNGGPGRSVALNSPWDVELSGNRLFIAMAGFHQIWTLDLESGEVRPYAGNGRERIEDGPLAEAELAQPSGIVADDNVSYFTDSETSAIRSADLTSAGVVTSIVGQDLFTFGDVDGSADEVRLQYPLGIDLHDGILPISDTYNNKIKRIYPHTREAASLLGSGRPCSVDGVGSEAEFREPGGISVVARHIYVADTNNHAIRVAALDTLEVSTLEIKGLK